MASQEALQELANLQNLLHDYFSGVDPSRSRELESILMDFKKQPESYKQCKIFLTLTEDEHVLWYCLTVFEELVSRLWRYVEVHAKIELRLFFFQYLSQKYSVLPRSVRSKVLEVIVDIGIVDWPHDFPNFFSVVIDQIQNPDTSVSGLHLFETLVEEIMNPKRNIVDSTRLEQLRSLLLQQLTPSLRLVLTTLQSAGASGLEPSPFKVNNGLTVPNSGSMGNLMSSAPSSPTLGRQNFHSTGDVSNSGKSVPSSPLLGRSPINASSSPNLLSNSLGQSLPNLGSEVCNASLSCLEVMIPFAKADQIAQVDVIPRLFEILSSPEYTAMAKDKSISCLLELIGSPNSLFPAQAEPLVLQMVQFLQKISSSQIIIDNDSDGYSGKIIETVRLFVKKYLQVLQNQGLTGDFLKVLFEFTSSQSDVVCFQRCLEIWIDIVEDQFVNLTPESFVQLCEVVITRGQFSTNPYLLQVFGDDDDYFDKEGEVCVFISDCVNIVSVVSSRFGAEFFNDIIYKLHGMYSEHCGNYQQLHLQIPIMNSQGEAEKKKFYQVCRDFYTCLMLMDRVIMCSSFPQDVIFMFVDNLVNLLKYGRDHQLFVHNSACVYIHSQIITTMRSCWYSLKTNDVSSPQAIQYLTSVLDNLFPLFTIQCDKEILLSAANLLQTLSFSTRPSNMLTLPCVNQFICDIPSLMGLPLEVQGIIFQSISNIFVLPWKDVTDQNQAWDQRNVEYAKFLTLIVSTYQSLTSAASATEVEQIKILSYDIKMILLGVKDEGKTSKNIVYLNIQPILPAIVQYLQKIDVLEVTLEVVLALFESLKTQLDAEYLKNLLSHIFDMSKNAELPALGIALADKLLLIFENVVKDGSSRFRALIPNVLSTCFTIILPWLQTNAQYIDTKTLLYRVIFEGLVTHWNIFYPAKNQNFGQLQNGELFQSLFESFYGILCDNEITTFKLCLDNLNDLNDKRRLFEKTEFTHNMSCVFIKQLICVLLQRSHELLSDKILETIFNIATADWEYFCTTTFPQLVTSLCTPEQQSRICQDLATDYPTFSRSLKLIVHDIRYYEFVNAN